jgi:predicted dehydrogenase
LLAAGGAFTIAGTKSSGKVLGSNDVIRVAVAGVNGRGKAHVTGYAGIKEAEVTYLVDPDQSTYRMSEAILQLAGRTQPTKAQDIRKVLDDPNVDAVSIATPNHWHSLMTIWACQAGKDVYVEKPCSHNLHEGRIAVETARKHKRIVQHGTQGRSISSRAGVVEFIRSGQAGTLLVSRGLCYKPRKSIGVKQPETPPSQLDFNLWLGPAPEQPFHRNLVHYNWHWFWDTGNGDIGNQGLHQMDVARWFLGEEAVAPSVLAVGGRLGYVDDGQTPNTVAVVHNYEAAPLIFEVRGLPAKAGAKEMDTFGSTGQGVGTIVHCEGGTVVVPALNYTWAQAFDRQGKLVKEFRGGASHQANFIQAVRSRRTSDLNIPAISSHVSSCLSHFSNISYRLGQAAAPERIREQVGANPALAEAAGRMLEHLRVNGVDLARTPATLGCPLQVDAATQTCVGNPAANALLTRAYRPPYVVPDEV